MILGKTGEKSLAVKIQDEPVLSARVEGPHDKGATIFSGVWDFTPEAWRSVAQGDGAQRRNPGSRGSGHYAFLNAGGVEECSPG
jgi:hypothetical protein